MISRNQAHAGLRPACAWFKNNNADALSRAPIDTSNHSTQGSILALTDQPVDNPPPLHTPTVADMDHQDLINHQQADDCLKPVIEEVRHNTPPATDRRCKQSGMRLPY